MAYSGFRAEISLKFYPFASFIPPVEQTYVIGEETSAPPQFEATLEIPVRPPSQVRDESDLPLPVLTTDSNGNPAEKWVKKKPRRAS